MNNESKETIDIDTLIEELDRMPKDVIELAETVMEQLKHELEGVMLKINDIEKRIKSMSTTKELIISQIDNHQENVKNYNKVLEIIKNSNIESIRKINGGVDTNERVYLSIHAKNKLIEIVNQINEQIEKLEVDIKPFDKQKREIESLLENLSKIISQPKPLSNFEADLIRTYDSLDYGAYG